MDNPQLSPIRLTQLSHGGGCGCKIAPALLNQLITSASDQFAAFPALLVGNHTVDDAAIYQLNAKQALVATVDFFMPIVDDPFDFGRVAAANALSDIYAMGGKPIMALAVVGMPLDKLSVAVIKRILEGGEAICRQANIPIAGGHSVDALEPIYGLVVLGLVHPKKIKRNSDAQAGDVLIIGKPLGIGVLAHAMKQGMLTPSAYQALIATTTQLNSVGEALGALSSVHAMTDITGFGLAGHLFELCHASQLGAQVHFTQLPILPEALSYAQQGIAPGATARNDQSFRAHLSFAPSLTSWQQNLLFDPQTSGGLMVAVAPDQVQQVLQYFHQAGFTDATAMGVLQSGPVHLYFE